MSSLKPFDLEAAKAGAKVVTRGGRPVRIICFDQKDENYPIVALVEIYDGQEELIECSSGGKFLHTNETHKHDLFMASVKHEGWVNLYKSKDCTVMVGNQFSYETEHEAYNMIGTDADVKYYIATIKIEWEE